jgi:hypothetical protein
VLPGPRQVGDLLRSPSQSSPLLPPRSEPRPVARRGSAWSGSRPCRRQGTSRDRPASRWPSSPRCAGARRAPAQRDLPWPRARPSRASARPSARHRRSGAATDSTASMPFDARSAR